MFRRAVAVAVTAAGSWLVVPAVAGAVVWGGAGGLVTGHRIGPLRMNLSGPNAVVRWAGRPSSVEYLDSNGGPTKAGLATWAESFYNGATYSNDTGTTYVFWWSPKGW